MIEKGKKGELVVLPGSAWVLKVLQLDNQALTFFDRICEIEEYYDNRIIGRPMQSCSHAHICFLC